MRDIVVHDFASWRQTARQALQQGWLPDACLWRDSHADQLDLLGGAGQMQERAVHIPARTFNIPAGFLSLAEKVSCHRDSAKWTLLYKVLWRLTHGEPHALALASDTDVHRLNIMAKQVSRDAHKAKAFVRFRSLGMSEGREQFAAWHCPDHKILPIVAPFFQRRFGVMDWTIMTPDQSVSWDGKSLVFGDGVPKDQAPAEDAMEEVWRTFYRAIFNPARIKIKMMKQEMPVRYWKTLPETRIIAGMLQEAHARVEEMMRHQEGFSRSAAHYLPQDRHLAALAQAARHCEGCPLHCHARQTVFGSGPDNARLMIVGEQPGAREDETGMPFTGPAGQVLMQALEEAGVPRDLVYLTNAVKHFKFTQRGEEKLHQSPNAREVNACKPWLEAEIAAVKPHIILGLGLTAAKSLVGHGFTMKEKRGKWIDAGDSRVLISYHPSSVLRAGTQSEGAEIYGYIRDDLKQAAAAAFGT